MVKKWDIKNISINNKIVAIILFISFVIVLTGSTLISVWEIKKQKKDVVSNLLISTKLVSDNCIIPLSFSDSKRAFDVLESFKNVELINESFLFDENGVFFASYPVDIAFDESILKSDSVYWKTTNKEIQIWQPIFFDNNYYGTLYVKADAWRLKNNYLNYVKLIVFSVLLLLTLTFLLAKRMQVFISGPILALNKHINKIAQKHDFSARITKINDDEIGDLYDGFNNMLGEIQHRIHQKEQAEEVAKESERRFTEIMKSVKLVSLILDTKAKILYCNEYFLSKTGYTEEQIIGKNWFKMFIPEEESVKITDIFTEAISGGEMVATMENLITTIDGTKLIISWNNTLLKDTEGEIIGIASIGEDITAQKKAKIALQESEEKFKMSFQSNPVPQAILTLEGIFVESNLAFSKLTGFSREEIIGKTSADLGLFSTEERNKLAEQAKASGGSIHNALAKFKIRDGSLRDILYSVEPIVLNGISHRLSMGIDVTEQKKAEEEVKKLNAELEERVMDRTKDLKTKISDIERMNKLFVGRELRMAELKKYIALLEAKIKLKG